jgi:hypothetical protein
MINNHVFKRLDKLKELLMEYLFAAAVIVFISGLMAVILQSVNHKKKSKKQ